MLFHEEQKFTRKMASKGVDIERGSREVKGEEAVNHEKEGGRIKVKRDQTRRENRSKVWWEGRMRTLRCRVRGNTRSEKSKTQRKGGMR